jgi:prophage regulatory protein
MKLLSREQVMEITTLHFTTIYRLMAKGEFPRPHQITERRVAWSEAEVDAWIKSRPRAALEMPPQLVRGRQ